MLSERQLEEVLKVFDNRMQEVTDDYIRRMGEHIRDIGRLTDSDVHRLTQMKRVNANVEAIKRAIAAAAEASMADIEAVFRAAAESDERFAQAVFAEDHTPTVKISPIKTLSSPLERILKAQLRVTAQEMANLSQTTLLSEAYRKAVDVAVQTVQIGVTDYTSAIRSAMKEAAKEGLRVQYPSGLTRRLDTAIRQNVLDGVRALNQDVLKQIGKEYGADGVEISAHALCAEDHLPYQGLQMSNKEFNRLQTLILDRPFGLWNCKHTVFPILLGVTPPAHSKEELAMYREYSTEAITIDGVTKSRYEWTQEQRRIETTIREQKHIANIYKASGDDMMRREIQRNINRLNDEYDLISRAAGLYRQKDRMAVAGFHKVKTVEQLKNPAERAKMVVEQKRSWLQRGYDIAVQQGDISALTGFEHYMQTAASIERNLVGLTTSDGITITGYKTHFIDRIIGSYEKKREPVRVEDVIDALRTDANPIDAQRNGKRSRQYRNDACWVTINPDESTIIQVSPRKKGE